MRSVLLAFVFFAMIPAWCAASVLEVVNVSAVALSFSGAAVGDADWAVVLPNSSRRWVVPDAETAVVLEVSSINGATVTSLGILNVSPETAYLVTYDGANGLVSSPRDYDAAQVFQAGGYRRTDLARWVKYGMVTQFAAEIAALCFYVLKVTRKGAIGGLVE